MNDPSPAPTGLADRRSDDKDVAAALLRRNAILDAVGYAATRIVAAADWRSGIQDLLQRLGQAMDVSRVTLFELHHDPAGVLVESCRYDWAEPGLVLLSGDPRYQDMAVADPETGAAADDWTLRRQRGEVVQATRGELTGYARQIFEEHGTFAFLSVPIMVAGRCWGFIGFDDCRQERSWAALETEVLHTAAALIGGAILRSEAEAHLKASEERYALAARGANDGLFDWDLASDRHYCAPRLYEIMAYGFRTGEVPPAVLCQRLRPQGHPTLWTAIHDHFERQKRRFEVECELLDSARRPTGRWLIARGLLLYRQGAAQRVVGSLRDVTQRKAAEAALRDSEAQARAILETASDAIVSADEQGRILQFNPAACRIFGYRQEEAVGRTVGELLVPPELRAGHEAGMRRFLASGVPQVIGRTVELEGQRADGGRVPIELALSEVPLGDRRLFTAILRDITERKRFERALAAAEAKRAQLARHFSPNIVEEILASGTSLEATRQQQAAVLFVDLFNFTALSGAMPGQEVIRLLREFHGLVEEAVFVNQGTLDKYIGDGAMATFGTPRPGPQDAGNALACARALVAAIVDWNSRRAVQGLQPLKIGVGLHYGPVTLGNVGSQRRLEFTVVGNTVNLASRIEGLTRLLEPAIIASAAVMEQARAEGAVAPLAGFTDLGFHAIRGHQEPVQLFGLASTALAPDAAA